MRSFQSTTTPSSEEPMCHRRALKLIFNLEIKQKLALIRKDVIANLGEMQQVPNERYHRRRKGILNYFSKFSKLIFN